LIIKGAVWSLVPLFGAGVIWIVVATGFNRKPTRAKASTSAPVPLAKRMPADTSTANTDGILMTFWRAEKKLTYPGPVTSGSSTIDQPAALPAPSPAAAPTAVWRPESNTAESESESQGKDPADLGPSNAGREHRRELEKERREAERKRARLEKRYQKGLISNEAYNSGQEEYQNVIERYRRETKER
jgi:hypothetical protein